VGVSLDSPESNKAFQAKFDFPYDLLCDTDKTMSIAYGAATADASRASRISYLIDAEGRVLKAYDTVKPAGHPDEVLADLG
jgi:peroxiredoxin Q/BCP